MKRPGFVLLFVLLVVAALELLALSTLALATHEAVAVSAEQRTVAAQRVAETALRRFARLWSGPGTLAVGGSHSFTDTAGVLLTIRRHAWGLYELTAAAPTGNSRVRAAMVLRTLDFPRAMGESAAAMSTVGAPPDPTVCTLPAAPAPPDTSLLSPAYAFGGLSWMEAPGVADSILPPQVSFTAADTVPRLLYRPGNLNVASGLGAGVLLVDGDLALGPGVEFKGVIVVRGHFTAAPGARITGSLWVQQQPAIAYSAQLQYSVCTCARALLQAPGAGRLIAARRRFIPAF